MKIENMISNSGNKIANQFIVRDSEGRKWFQSYDSMIVVISYDHKGRPITSLDKNTWDYSRTTARYRNQFLGETTKETQAKIDSGKYQLVNLN